MMQPGFDSVMLDIEALGPRPDGALVSIGAFAFEQDGFDTDESLTAIFHAASSGGSDSQGREPLVTDRSFYAVVSLQSALAAGGKVGADTLQWWLKQSPDARAVLSQKGAPIGAVLPALARFLEQHRSIQKTKRTFPHMWGFPAHYDATMVEDVYRALRIACPWDALRSPRDVRTLTDTIESMGVMSQEQIMAMKPKVGILHHALCDALSQAAWVQRLRHSLRGALR